MQIRELRVGNYIKVKPPYSYDNSFATKRFVKIDISFFFSAYKDKEFFGYFEPVELSQDILKKIGFEFSIGSITRQRKYSLNNVILIHIHINDSFVFANFEVEIKYLHQLQNLYHALTGNEIDIWINNLIS